MSVALNQDGIRPEVSFVVLNWHNRDATLACVNSIVSLRRSVPIEIIVVDNESTEESRSGLDEGPWRLVCLSSNRGFTGGMNAGAAAARGAFIALLNNDLLLEPDWLEHALDTMALPGAAIIGGRDQETTVPIVYPSGALHLSRLEIDRCAVPTVDGGHVFIRGSVWRELEGFDDDFFAYHEDADLCARALALGYRVIYDPELRARHPRGSSSGRVRWRRVFWARRNRLIWLAKHFPEADWVAVIRAVATEYAREVLLGSGRARFGSRADLEGRAGSLAALIWLRFHPGWLAAKREATIISGQHQEDYRDLVAQGLAALREDHPELV
jgi:GT2 family glycosyltransferase